MGFARLGKANQVRGHKKDMIRTIINTIMIILAIGIVIGVPLHIVLVMLPEAKEASSHGGDAYNAWLSNNRCYEVMLGMRCFGS
jgi:hypothetical protein